LDPALGGQLRTVGDIGTHWLDLTGFITGLRVEAVMADFSTFITTRKKPSHPIDTFAGKTAQIEDYVEQPIDTEDCAMVLLAYEGGARGAMTVSQLSAGRKNRLSFEVDGSRSALAWDSEQPNELWIGHRDRPNERLLKDPSLLTTPAQARASYPGGHNEGFPDTFKQLYRAVYGYIQAGDPTAPPDFPTFADGHEQMLLCQAIQRSAREKAWVTVAR
jgi:predicted dehydrogenase